MDFAEQFRIAGFETVIATKICIAASREKSWDKVLPGVVADHWDNFVRRLIAHQLPSEDHLLITNTTLAAIGLLDIVRAANCEHSIGTSQACLHETRQIAAKAYVPLVKDHVYPIANQPIR